MIFLRAILFFIILIFNATALAMPPIMPLAEVQPGMYGTGYTIVEHTGAVEPFNVKIVGTVANGKGSPSRILAEASGDLMNRVGGVLQGMSGSPIYINGKLVGALSAGLKEMDPRIFLITPIEDMTAIWNQPDNFAPNKIEEETVDENSATENLDGEEIFDKEEIFNVEEKAVFVHNGLNYLKSNIPDFKNLTPAPAEGSLNLKYDTSLSGGVAVGEKNFDAKEKAVFIYNGFDSAGLNYLKSNIPDFKNLTPASAEGSLNLKYNASLSGGDAFGVAVVYGDFVVGATGTVTAVEQNKVVGFGHPFMHNGNVNYFMTDVNMIGPVAGAPGGGMKIASLGSIIGRINQDRSAGIAGILGQFPSVVPINVTVNGETYNSLMAYNETLMAKLGTAIAYSALSKCTDSSAESTVKVSFDIKTNAVSGGTLSRENIYYSPSDVGQVALIELLNALTIVTTNTTAESDLLGIDVKIDYEMERKTASLVKAESLKRFVKPGETIDLKIILQPYRKPAEEIFVKYTVPITANEGNFVLDLHGGGLVPVTQVQQAGVIMPTTKSPAELYNEKISALLKTNKNNEIIIKPAAVAKTEKELKEDIKRARKILAQYEKLGKKLPAAQPPAKIPTNYIIDNVVQCTLKVDKF